MTSLLEYVGNVHIYLGPYRGNPIALYLKRNGDRCVISPKVYPWNEVVGVGETPNKAAADFEDKWKSKGLSPEMYTGPSWEGGIKPERPKPAPPPKPPAAAPPAGAAQPGGGASQTSTPAPQQKSSEEAPHAAADPTPAPPPASSGAGGQASASQGPTGAPSAPPQPQPSSTLAAARPAADGSVEPPSSGETPVPTNSADDNGPAPQQN